VAQRARLVRTCLRHTRGGTCENLGFWRENEDEKSEILQIGVSLLCALCNSVWGGVGDSRGEVDFVRGFLGESGV
jgi:hypothetical protein